MAEMFDLVIQDGFIEVDGTGNSMYKADIAIKDGKIAKIGKYDICDAKKIIDSKGLIVSPGFIDIHSHGDCTVLMFPKAESAIMQGVTTIVVGNCGISPAPLERYWVYQFWEQDFWHDIQPYIFYENPIQPIKKVKQVIKKRFGINIDWNTFGEFLERIENNGTSVNLVPLVGHGQIKAQVMGVNSEKEALEDDLEEMEKYLHEAMGSGAFGMSTGLDYSPGAYSSTAEIIRLAKIVREYDGIYATHWRRTGVRRGTPQRPKKIKGIEEAICVSREAEIKTQISHLSSGYEIYPNTTSATASLQRASANATLDIIDHAINQGVEIAFDVIPNASGGIGTTVYLATYLAPWLRQAGSVGQFAKNIVADDLRAHIKNFIATGQWYVLNPKINPDWGDEITILAANNKNYKGKTITQIAESKNKDVLDTFLEILTEDPYAKCKREFIDKEWVKVFLQHSKAMVCSDSFVLNDRSLAIDTEIPWILPHPNTYCAFPRYMLNYGSRKFEDTIKRITKLPARWLGITDRGVIQEKRSS